MERITQDHLKLPKNAEKEQPKLYTLLNNDDRDHQNIPVDPNLLRFNSKQVSHSYAKYIFLNNTHNKLSDTTVTKLLIFFLFLWINSICFISFTLSAYSKDDLPRSHLIFHLVFNSVIPILSTLSMILLANLSLFIKQIHLIFSLITFLAYTYLLLSNKVILSNMLGTEIPEYGVPYSVSIVGLSVFLKYVIRHNFVYILLVNTAMVLEYVILVIFIPANYSLENLSNFICVTFFIFLQIIDSKNEDLTLKKNFWERFQKDESLKTMTHKFEESNNSVKTETEILIGICENVKKTLKHCCNVIIFKDIKDHLKLAQVQIEQVKQKIGQQTLLDELKISQQVDIDPEDKKFISENFIDFSHINTPERSAISEVTVINFKERSENFPFAHYGLEKLESVLSQFGKIWGFDIWFIHDATGHSISIIGKYLFQKWQLTEYLKQLSETSDRFFEVLESGYKDNPYHNACHAADVLHTQIFFISQSNLSKSLTQLDVISCIIASLGHDIGHPALTNRFLVNNCDDLAIRYNDTSVLENMHTAKTFKILKQRDCKILENLESDDWLKCRKMIIEMILETDMSKHFEILGKFRTRVVTLSNLDVMNFDDKCQILGMSLKCADIGHSAKDYVLHEKWSLLVCEEFFKQGDIEKNKGQSISMYCDRENTDIPKSQAGFIKNICVPLYEAWSFYLKSETVDKFCLDQLKRNFEFWTLKKKRRSTVKYGDFETDLEKIKRFKSLNN